MRGYGESDRHVADSVAAELLDFLLRPAHVVEDCRRARNEGLAEWRGDHAFGASLEQRGADLVLQLGQAARLGCAVPR
jgi:hypothetical protein